jgi:hypothetical protein
MSRSERPFLVGLHPTALQVMMEIIEGVLDEANMLNFLGYTACRSVCACSLAAVLQLGHLGNTRTMARFVFQWYSWW